VEFIELSEFRLERPELAKLLEMGHPFVTDNLYAYRLSAKGKWIVERVWIELFKVGGKSAFHIPAERHLERLKDAFQTKILET